MPLTTYKQKRNLKKSGEPKPKIKSPKLKKPIYLIHKHKSTHLHYDLRLEMNGVLKSWAIPKQPPRTKGLKRLAIEVEDHPLEYAKFQGIIPKGNYGAGKVEIWDNGTYELIKKTTPLGVHQEGARTSSPSRSERRPQKSELGGKIEFKLHGKKLKGNYVLIKTGYDDKKKEWLFFKLKN